MLQLLDQNKNYAADFGQVFRSSAIFYIPKDIKTTISLSNYWELKNAIKVSIVVSERHLDGRLAVRHEMHFLEPVLNISDFSISEGSVEIEVFSGVNLRIPYAAIMVMYEAESSASMVHSYGRNHSLIELENNEVSSAEDAPPNLAFQSAASLRGELYRSLETWSRFCVDKIVESPS